MLGHALRRHQRLATPMKAGVPMSAPPLPYSAAAAWFFSVRQRVATQPQIGAYFLCIASRSPRTRATTFAYVSATRGTCSAEESAPNENRTAAMARS